MWLATAKPNVLVIIVCNERTYHFSISISRFKIDRKCAFNNRVRCLSVSVCACDGYTNVLRYAQGTVPRMCSVPKPWFTFLSLAQYSPTHSSQQPLTTSQIHRRMCECVGAGECVLLRIAHKPLAYCNSFRVTICVNGYFVECNQKRFFEKPIRRWTTTMTTMTTTDNSK